MKHLVVLLAGVILASCGVSRSSAIDYNDTIIEEQTKVIGSIDDLLSTFSENDPAKMDAQLESTIKDVAAAQEMAKGVESFDGSTAFRDAFVSLLDVLMSGLKTEYPQLIENLKIPNEEYTEEDEEEYNKIATISDEKFEVAQDNFLAAQKTFAEKYGFILVE